MSRIDTWMDNVPALAYWLDDIDNAYDTARLIADKPISIIPIRGGLAQSAETVRIEFLYKPREMETAGGQTVIVDTLVLGYKGHPTIDDTDLVRGDRFAVSGQQYEVMVIAPGMADQLQAYCKVRN